MPRILFIRVSAATYDEKDVPKTWPLLYAAVWPDAGLAGEHSPAKLARKLIPAPERGVLELLDALVEHARFAELSDNARKVLVPATERLESLRHELDEALGNRDVKKAESLCVSIENALDDAESAMRGL